MGARASMRVFWCFKRLITAGGQLAGSRTLKPL